MIIMMSYQLSLISRSDWIYRKFYNNILCFLSVCTNHWLYRRFFFQETVYTPPTYKAKHNIAQFWIVSFCSEWDWPSNIARKFRRITAVFVLFRLLLFMLVSQCFISILSSLQPLWAYFAIGQFCWNSSAAHKNDHFLFSAVLVVIIIFSHGVRLPMCSWMLFFSTDLASSYVYTCICVLKPCCFARMSTVSLYNRLAFFVVVVLFVLFFAG